MRYYRNSLIRAAAVLAAFSALLVIAPAPAQAFERMGANASSSSRWMDSGDARVWANTPGWIRDLGLCIRKHESLQAGHYNAENPTSTASGAYQFLDGTWRGNAKWTKVNGKYVARGYARASDAPAWVQDAVFVHAIKGGGIKAWHGTWCSGT